MILLQVPVTTAGTNFALQIIHCQHDQLVFNKTTQTFDCPKCPLSFKHYKGV